jgi:hypothetical protein
MRSVAAAEGNDTQRMCARARETAYVNPGRAGVIGRVQWQQHAPIADDLRISR